MMAHRFRFDLGAAARLAMRRARANMAIAPMVAITTAVMVSGCGGNAIADPNLYRGAWSGNWSSDTLQNDGSLDLTISADGSVVGTMTNTEMSWTGAVAGTMGSKGDFNATVDFGGGIMYSLKGTVIIGGENTLKSAFAIVYQEDAYGASFELRPNTGGSSGS